MISNYTQTEIRPAASESWDLRLEGSNVHVGRVQVRAFATPPADFIYSRISSLSVENSWFNTC